MAGAPGRIYIESLQALPSSSLHHGFRFFLSSLHEVSKAEKRGSIEEVSRGIHGYGSSKPFQANGVISRNAP